MNQRTGAILLATLGAAAAVVCPFGWLTQSSICYLFDGSINPVSYSSCESFCSGYGGRPLCIEDSSKQSYLESHNGNHDLWVSLNDMSTEGDYVWGSGCVSSYFPWAPSEPSESSSENCVSLYANGAGINDRDCSDSMNTYCACQGDDNDILSIYGIPDPTVNPSIYPTIAPTTAPAADPTVQPTSFYDSDGTCPDGFDYSFGDKCYALNVQAGTSWSGCQSACSALHADMLCVTHQGENDFLYANNVGSNYIQWLGYNDAQGDTTYQWDGTCASAYTNWALDEPDRAGSGCAGLWPSVNGWNDFDCNDAHMCSCEWTSAVTITTPPVHNPCEAGWQLFEGKCYYFSAPDSDWQGCSNYCVNNQAATMSCIEDSAENAYVVGTSGKFTWIGYNDLGTEGSFVWQQSCPSSYTNWKNGEPNNGDGAGEDCTAIEYNAGPWIDATCTDSAGCVCEKPSEPVVDPQGDCPDGWLQDGSGCYLVDLPSSTWNDCRATCQALSAQMICVDGLEKDMFLHDAVSANTWLGYNDKTTEGTFVWDGTCSSSYEYWKAGQPAAADCVYLDWSRGYAWGTQNCADDFAYCACQIPLSEAATYGEPTTFPTVQTTTFYDSDGTCPNGFDYSFGDKCYALNVQAGTSWTGCKSACSALHADMLCVASQGENDYLYASNGGNIQWLGYNDAQGDTTYQWDGTCASAYTNWALDEPDRAGSGGCAGLWPSVNGWNDFDCSDPHMCSCEWTSAVTITTPPVHNPCEAGWQLFEGKCYYFSAPDSDWPTCRNYCETILDATMTCLENSAQNAYVGTTHNRHTWTGYSDSVTEGSFVWPAGCTSTFTSWLPSEPSNDGGIEDCAVDDYQLAKWNDVNCGDTFGCVCEMPGTPVVDPQGGCPDGWLLDGNSCYRVNIGSQTWDECSATCHDMSAEMLCVDSLDKDIFLHDAASANTWLGYNDKITEGTFVWDGTCSSSYEYWKAGQPAAADCVYMNRVRGYAWATQDCVSNHAQCACQIPLSAAAAFGQPTVYPTVRPSKAPTAGPSLPAADIVPESVLSSPTYRPEIGFAFAAIGSDGSVHTWGEASKGGDSSAAQHHLLAAGAVAVVASRYAFAALMSNFSVVPWGARTSVVGAPTLDTEVTDLVANEGAFAAIHAYTRAVVAFGTAQLGGDVTTPSRYNPYASQLSANVSSIAASACAFCAVTNRGNVYAWGSGHCGAGVSTETTPSLRNVQKVVATREAFAALLSSGRVLTWGGRYSGGDSSAVASQLLSGVIHLIASKSVFVAFKASTGIVVWGYPQWGGDASIVASDLTSGVVSVAQTFTAMAALKSDGSVVAWGSADGGGDASAVQAQLVNVVQIFGAGKAFAALTATGRVVPWGKAAYGGQIPSSKMSALSSGVVSVYHTDRAFAALKSDGSVVVWGQAGHGGSPGTAVEAHLVSGVHTVCSNDAAFSVIKTDGSVVGWGHPVSIPTAGVIFISTQLHHNVTCSNKL